MSTSTTDRRQAVWFLLIAATLWSTSGIFVKLISWSPLAILGGRSLVAFFVVWLYVRRVPLRYSLSQVVGAVCYVGAQLFFVWATKLTTAANAIFLQYASPLYVVAFGYFFLKEKPRRVDILAMLTIFCGMFLFFGDQLSLNGLVGNILAVISGVAMAGMMVSLRHQKDGTPALTILLGSSIGFFIGLPFMFGEDFSVPSLAIILFLGVFQIGISFILYSVAIKKINVLEANLLVTLEPILNPIWVFLFLGERPGALAIIGSVVVIGAVLFRAVISSQPDKDGRTPSDQAVVSGN